ncbi:hypothetical protein SAMN05660964_03810 [Thiothrix caldifontis]|uniref:LRAT domain-containing protein n=1 Tax=Thiothrix caldifontis TaxID=525918 RepID=A0A1H4GYB3_9GAMM|nr:lecithin retinol acyltransferase family protein [Thiothrix caldifontis]SEB14537.1 hypothetical protein SAMN05660964_03810 [Thiothrix caldifontis]
MAWRLLTLPISNMIEGIIDTCRDRVSPIIGSVLYCDLAFGYMEHSGIYVGNNKIVHLSGSGKIEIVNPKQFVDGGSGCGIYVSCYDNKAVGSNEVARVAESMVGRKRNYNFILDNCHQFSAGCLTGNFENPCNFLWMLKKETAETIGSNTWRFWDISLFS